MKQIFLIAILVSEIFAFFDTIGSFQADFIQTVTDDKNKVLTYKGNILASKPQNAIWRYLTPINKDVYISSYKVTIIEPEIEQAIIRKIESNFDFFKMIENAKKSKDNIYITKFKNTSFTIFTKDNLIESISYIDEFENNVKILFENQKQNEKIDENIFIPNIPLEFDIIRD